MLMFRMCVSLVPLASGFAHAEITNNTDYYSITASTAEELNQQLSLNSRNGYHADTQWRIKPRYRFKQSPSGCSVTDSSIELIITYSMPQWQNKSQAPVALQLQWDNWYANLLRHEKNHGFHGRQAYYDVKQAIYGIGRASSCGVLTKQLGEVIDGILFKYSQEDIFYDQRTKHGATEGTSVRFSAIK